MGAGGISISSLKSTSPNLTKQEEIKATWYGRGRGSGRLGDGKGMKKVPFGKAQADA